MAHFAMVSLAKWVTLFETDQHYHFANHIMY